MEELHTANIKENSVINQNMVKLRVKEKVAFGFGDFSSNLFYAVISYFLLYFYTDINGLSATSASLIFVIARVLDAVFNLLIGFFIDRTKSKYGKLRPYLLYGSIPLSIISIMCFWAPNLSANGKFIYALVTYTLFSLSYTLVNTPYSALPTVMTKDSNERSILTSYRMVFAMLGGLAVTTFYGPLTTQFILNQVGYAPDSDITVNAMEGIKYSITLIPMILLGVTLIIMAFYRLDAKKYKEITDELAKRE